MSVHRYAAYVPIHFNEAYNLQIAQSIARYGCYCTTYFPRRVFPVEESTNGIPQYVGAAFFAATHDPDAVVIGTATLGTAALVVALLFLEPWLVAVSCILFRTWTSYFFVSTQFEGEIWALAFAVFGIALLRKYRNVDGDPATDAPITPYGDAMNSASRASLMLRDRKVLMAIVFFALAMECKLLVAIAVFPIAFAILARKSDARSRSTMIDSAIGVLAISVASFAILFLLIAFSVVHSTRGAFDVGSVGNAFFGFIGNMISQGQNAAGSTVGFFARIASFFDPMALVVFCVASIILLGANVAYFPLAAVTIIWFFGFGRGGIERHMVMSLYLTTIMGAMEARAMLGRFAMSGKAAIRTYCVVAVCAFGVFLAVNTLVGRPFIGKVFEQQVAAGYDREHVIRTSANASTHYTRRLVEAIRREPYVVTSGWWQFPELSIREGLSFYDRMKPQNDSLPKGQVALLFDEGNRLWPPTSRQANCGKVLYREGSIVLCRVRADVAIDYQGTPR
jgi:hypothetical protein